MKIGFVVNAIETEHEYYTMITDNPDADWGCTLAQAEQWRGRIDYRDDGTPYRTEGPDWHSASWCTTDEFAKVLGTYMLEADGYMYSPMWDAMLAAMRALEERDHDVRMVYWFDN